MDLAATLTECAIDAAREAVPDGASMVWLFPAEGDAISIVFPAVTRWRLDQWLAYIEDRLATYVRQVLLQLDAAPTPVADLTAASAYYTPVPTRLAVLLPLRAGPVIEAVGEIGDAIRVAYPPNPANVGLGHRTIRREVSLAAHLLRCAQRPAPLSGTLQAFLN